MSKVLSSPKYIDIHLQDHNIKVSKKIKYMHKEKVKTFRLRGVTYFGNFHYTSRVIDEHSNVWYHDGISTGDKCMAEGRKLKNMSDQDMLTCKNKRIRLAIYAR